VKSRVNRAREQLKRMLLDDDGSSNDNRSEKSQHDLKKKQDLRSRGMERSADHSIAPG
jgi:hypothetical protein